MPDLTVGVAFEIVLIFGLGFPQIADRRDFRGGFAGSDSRRIDVGDGVAADALCSRTTCVGILVAGTARTSMRRTRNGADVPVNPILS
jgi:hypothetical protein